MRLALIKNYMAKKEETPIASEPLDDHAALKALLEKNIELSEEILAKVKYVKRYIFWKRVMSVIFWLFIILSTVASIFYLPPLIAQLQGQIQSMISGATSGLPAGIPGL